jgi:peptidoglycan/xylan/chitin deacetylase (PgdA/CDA1 family)
MTGLTVLLPNPATQRSTRKAVSGIVRRLALHSGVSAHLARRQGRPRILMFHAVGGDGEQTVYPYQRAYATQVFEAEIRYLLRHFTIVPLDRIVERIEGNGAGDGRNELALTFDDGLRNTAKTAYPILRELGVPATFFICPALLDSGEWQWTYECSARLARLSRESRAELLHTLGAPTPTASADAVLGWMGGLADSQRKSVVRQIREATRAFEPSSVERFNFDLMTWDDVGMLDRSLVAIGSHSMTHPVLSRTDPGLMRREIVDSKRMLEDRLARPVNYFCYPDGAYSPEVLDLVRRTYRAAVTTRPDFVRPGQDRWLLPRIGAGEEDVHDLAWRLHRPSS